MSKKEVSYPLFIKGFHQSSCLYMEIQKQKQKVHQIIIKKKGKFARSLLSTEKKNRISLLEKTSQIHQLLPRGFGFVQRLALAVHTETSQFHFLLLQF